MKVIRVFPRRTSFTPVDDYSFVGDPPLWRPDADEVHISCTFTWDIKEAQRLAGAWSQFYPAVKVDGPAFDNFSDGFEPGVYIKHGVTFTTRGCNNHCPWCLVPQREGELRTLEIKPGYIIEDNNLLQAPRTHIESVFAMLRSQKRGVQFKGGLDKRLISDWVVEEFKSLNISELWLACDTKESLPLLKKVAAKLAFLPRSKLRCYVLIGFQGESLSMAEDRLRQVFEAGCMPFAQPYQPADKYIDYSSDWRWLAKYYSRPAGTKIVVKLDPRFT